MLKRKWTIMLIIALVLGLLPAGGFAGKAYAATNELSPLADVMLFQGLTYDNDFGSKLYVGIGEGEQANSLSIERAALRFQIGTYTGIVTKYELVLPVYSIEDSSNQLQLNIWGSDNNDLLDTHTTLPAHHLGVAPVIVPRSSLNANALLTVDVTSIVNAFTDASDKDITFVLTGNESATSYARMLIWSKEHLDAARRPKLIVTYTPNQPPTGTININNGAAYVNTTAVTLNLTAADPEGQALQMRFSNDNLSWSSWEAYAATKSWSLGSGDGLKTVYYQLQDSVGLASSVFSDTITVDTVVPVISGVSPGGLYNINKTITFNKGTGKLDGAPFTSGSIVSAEGAHTLVVTDDAGNSASVTFTIDKTPPTVTGVANGSRYNTNRNPAFVEGTATLNGAPYTSGTTISAEGMHTLVVTDAAGNSASITFTIDKTPPIVTGVDHGGVYNTNKTITFNEGSATLGGASFSSGSTVSAEGVHTLVVTDAAGNSASVTFTIDKTPPVVTGVTNGASYNTDKAATFTEGTATLNGAPYTSGTAITTEGSYVLEVTDTAGNRATISFSIDKTPPVVTGVDDGGVYNTDKTVSFNEGSATLGGASFSSGSTVSAEGVHMLVVTDAAGNSASVTFTIDKTPPVVTGVTNGASYNTDKAATFTEGTATLNSAPYTSGTAITAEDSYVLEVTDTAGNKTTISFSIDKTPPVVTGVDDGEVYNTDKTVSFNEGYATLNGSNFISGTTVSAEDDYELVVTDPAGNSASITFTIDKTPPTVTGVTEGSSYNTNVNANFTDGTATLNSAPYTSGTAISAEDSYVLEVTDTAGNKTTISFSIDKTPPVVTGVDDGGVYNTDKAPTFNEGTATLNDDPYTSGTAITAEDSYVLEVTDTAGNKTTISFSIDKTPPVVTGVDDGESYNTNRAPVYNEGTATLNDDPYTSGTAITAEDSYVLEVTDAAGNKTTVSFSIDKTPPVVTGVDDGGVYNTDKTVSFNEGYATLNGSNFISGTTVSAEDDYTLIVTDPAGNSASVTFTIDKTPPTVTGVTGGSSYNTNLNANFTDGTATLNSAPYTSGTAISAEDSYVLEVTDTAGNKTTVSFSIDKTPPVVTGVDDGGVYNTDKAPTFNEGTATLNDDLYTSGTAITAEDSYVLEVTDTAGNKTTVSFSIDKTPPVVTGVTNGASYNTDKAAVYNEGTATLNSAPYTSSTAITAEDSYVLEVTDAAGNKTTISFSIDKTPPIVTGVDDGGVYNTDITVSFNEGSATLNGSNFTSGTTVSAEDDYVLVVTDTAGNSTTVTFTIDKTPPTVTGVTEGSSYNTNVTATFTDGTATLNGAPYTSGTAISTEDSYVLEVTDTAGNKATISFSIDKTPPIVTGVDDGGVYNADITVSFNEGSATLNGSNFTSGTTVSAEDDYVLVVTDTAGNSTTVTFTIDKTPPTVTGVTEGSSYNTNVTATFTDGTATLNDDPYTSGTAISAEGSYVLEVTDTAGNKTTIAFQLDKTAPIVTGVADGMPAYTAPVTIAFNEGTATLNNAPFSSGTKILVSGTYTLIVADAAGNQTTISFQLAIPSSGGGGNVPGSYLPITVNGIVLDNVAKLSIVQTDGKQTTTLRFDEQAFVRQLSALSSHPKIVIPVNNGSDQVITVLSGQLLQALEDKSAAIQIQAGNAAYTLSAGQLDLKRLAASFGAQASLKDIELSIRVANVPDTEIESIRNGLKGISLISPAIEFSITASSAGKTVELKQFLAYVERTIAIPGGVNSDRGITGVLLTKDGKLVPVPTRIVKDNGKAYATLYSLTNSVYAVIRNEKTFTDITSHWAKAGIEDMASKLIIQGVNEQLFQPNKSVSRAEFSAILVRALGLQASSDSSLSFADVQKKDWFYEPIGTAVAYGLFEDHDGRFNPNEPLTREEAMVILFKGMQAAGMNVAITNQMTNEQLNAFKDQNELQFVSRSAAALSIQYGIINGNKGLILPDKPITRAESALIVQRFLKAAKLND